MICTKCGATNNDGQRFCGGCGGPLDGAEVRKVGLGLGIGIVFVPLVFVWFTLRAGYTALARGLAFGWLALVIVFAFASEGRQARPQPYRQDAPTSSMSVAPPPASPPAATAPAEVVQPASAPTSAPPTSRRYGTNDRFQLGSFAYDVAKFSVQRVVGNATFNRRASDGALFVIVTFTIENLGSETTTVLTDDFVMRDGAGRRFRPASEANTTLSMTGENKDLLVSQLQPGIKKRMITAFEVPEAALYDEGMILVIPEKGLLGSDEIEVGPVKLERKAPKAPR